MNMIFMKYEQLRRASVIYYIIIENYIMGNSFN